MEDIIKALLDVVRAQHTAAEGTEAEPFNMDDIVDMALNIVGRPEEAEEEKAMVESIQDMVETLAPDIFPPKTFEELDDAQQAATAVNMIEERLMRGLSQASAFANKTAAQPETPAEEPSGGEEEEDTGFSGFNPQETADLNDLIYKNFMEMMGLHDPQVEYPFDRSQVRYGKEKSMTELLEEEQAAKTAEPEESRSRRPMSAWELAQAAVDQDEEIHHKEEYVPKEVEMPQTKSASQLAAEAIAKSQKEEAAMKLEVEKQAERLMEEAKRRGQDPMAFALHQQEILRYMEKNSDELVSFEDYEDLSPEERYEIEKQIHIEKQIADGVDPDEVSEEVPEEYIPDELRASRAQKAAPGEEEAAADAPSENAQKAETAQTAFTEEMLRQLSAEVIRENADMILAENADEDMDGLQEAIFANIQEMMSGSGGTVPPEDVGELLQQAMEASLSKTPEDAAADSPSPENVPTAPSEPLSAVELAKAAQAAAKPEPQPVEGKSAVELAKEAQAEELAKKVEEAAAPEEEPEEVLTEEDFDFDDLIGDFSAEEEASDDGASEPEAAGDTGEPDSGALEPESEAAGEEEEASDDEEPDGEIPEPKEEAAGAIGEEPADEVSESESETAGDAGAASDTEAEEAPDDAAGDDAAEETSDAEAYESVDSDEKVLGDHTQAEIDEALENLGTLGLTGEVYDRAKRMLLLELAGSEAALDAWLKEQENGKKRKTSSRLDDDEDIDLDALDEDSLERELELAMDEDFLGEDFESDDGEAEEPEEEEDEARPEESEEAESAEESASDEPKTAAGDEEEPKSEARGAHSARAFRRKPKKAAGKEKKPGREGASAPLSDPEEKGYHVSVRKPFVLKNSASFMDQFEEYIVDTQENRKLSTGFQKLDAMLRYGLHKGSYFIDAQPQYLKNSFMQQIADRAAEAGIDVLYISTELSRYDLMVDTISRISYEIGGGDPEKAVSAMSIMTGEEGADLASLKDELNWYRGRISEHLFILDQEAVEEYVDSTEEASAGVILADLIRSIVTDGAHKPVVFIDNIENILSAEDSADMEPLMAGIRSLAKELAIPIILSYGYAQMESEAELSPAEEEFHESLGSMCDVYLELRYAQMISEDSLALTPEEIRELAEEGEELLVDVILKKNRRTMRASCQIQATPKYNYFEE